MTIALFSISQTYGQQKVKYDYKLASKKEQANYFDIVRKKEKEIKDYNLKDINDLKEFKHYHRWAEFWRIRVNADGSFPDENLTLYNTGVLNNEGKIAMNNFNSKNNNATTWVNIGTQEVPDKNGYPNYPQMGRLNAFLRIAHPTNNNQDVLFVGTQNGGIWKSTDGGATWTPKLDIIAGIGVTDIKTTPDATFSNYTTKPIYVSTGDYDDSHVKSIGVLKSTDGGETYASTNLSYTLKEDKLTGDLVVVDENTVFVGTSAGISKTLDGGANWSQAFDGQATNANMGRVAVSGNKIMYTGIFDVAFTENYTDDANWKAVNGSSGSFNKLALTVGEDNAFYIQDMVGQIKKYDEANNTFTDIGTIPAGYNSQDGYNQSLIVKNDMIISGEFNATHSTDNGASWYRSLNGYWSDANSDGNYIHSDHHRLGSLDGNLKFWSANDGGLNYITYASNTDQKPTIEYLSAKTIVTQHFSVAINPKVNGDDYLTGNQDNDGFSKIDGTWYAVALGDGIETAINYNDPSIRYATNQNGLIVRSDAGFKGELNGDYSLNPAGISFNHYMEMDRLNPSILYMNADKGGSDPTGIFKITDDGTALTSELLDSGTPIHKFNTHNNLIMGVSDNNIIRKIPTDGSAATSITGATNIGNGVNIESIDFITANSNYIYVTSKGYNDGNKIFASRDGGATFRNITNNLPDVIINKVLFQQANALPIMFFATNVGVYFTKSEGATWHKLGNGLPNVDVKDIEINYTAQKLVAATFGRGLWSIDISAAALGVDTFKETGIDINLYPNPVTSGVLKISTEENLTNLKYEIYNIVGGIVKKGTVNNTKEINVDNLTNNVYLIRVFNNNKSVTKKFVLTK
ncbi:T9SS type A sorting domain-containing protein [Polaribacter sp. R77954]|uniref:T9SS type A sorting domain-containing protein n=1 Tax=Polaribacter sp. R77954 TaxID=3093870 RepID=UPI0037C7511E